MKPCSAKEQLPAKCRSAVLLCEKPATENRTTFRLNSPIFALHEKVYAEPAKIVQYAHTTEGGI
jgi:hypothetical protein